MIRLRSVRPEDAGGIIDMLRAAGPALNGLSTLRPYPDLIERRVELGSASFAGRAPSRAEEVYFFVLEDTAEGSVIGTGAIYAAVGLNEAFYSYKVGKRVFTSRELGVYQLVPTLFLTNDYTGKTEIGSLFVDKRRRRTNSGRLASVGRMLYLAEFSERFSDIVFAEMRGYQLADGTSPFWEGIGRHFFGIPFTEADDLSARGNKLFIAELMPSMPIYVSLLPESVQETIGRVHEATVPARKLLEREGFGYSNYVDIFDGGPTLEAPTRFIRGVAESRVLRAAAGHPPEDSRLYLVSNRDSASFRVVACPATVDGDQAVLTDTALHALEIDPGASVRMLPLRP